MVPGLRLFFFKGPYTVTRTRASKPYGDFGHSKMIPTNHALGCPLVDCMGGAASIGEPH